MSEISLEGTSRLLNSRETMLESGFPILYQKAESWTHQGEHLVSYYSYPDWITIIVLLCVCAHVYAMVHM